MVAERITRAVLERSRARGVGRLVLLVLADRASECGIVVIDIRIVAKEARITRRSAARSLRRLHLMGEIRVVLPLFNVWKVVAR